MNQKVYATSGEDGRGRILPNNRTPPHLQPVRLRCLSSAVWFGVPSVKLMALSSCYLNVFVITITPKVLCRQFTCLMYVAGQPKPLIELAAKAVACHIPFAIVECYSQPIPEDLQLKIAFFSFPESEEDIR